jgi:hypothetical protein
MARGWRNHLYLPIALPFLPGNVDLLQRMRLFCAATCSADAFPTGSLFTTSTTLLYYSRRCGVRQGRGRAWLKTPRCGAATAP